MGHLPATSSSPGALAEVARCSGSDRPILQGEIHYRFNGRTYCALEVRRMFPEVFDPKLRLFNTIMGWGGVIGAPALAAAAMFVALQVGLSPGRAGGTLALLVVATMYGANKFFLAPAAESRRMLEKVEPGGIVRRLG